MKIEPLHISGAYLFTPTVHRDPRGGFLEWLRQQDVSQAVGRPFDLAQANWSTSRRGVVRGIHYADVPPGQAKYVTCVRGSVLDVVVDLRVGSPTFGRHELVELSDAEPQAVYLDVGLGHGFCALTDDATVVYLCSTAYNPSAEHAVNPLDPRLAIPWPREPEPILSPKDTDAPGLEETLRRGALPTAEQCGLPQPVQR